MRNFYLIFVNSLFLFSAKGVFSQTNIYKTTLGNYAVSAYAGGSLLGINSLNAVEYPKANGTFCLNGLHLWVSAKDAQGNYHMAISDPFRTGSDFGYGPIDTINGATENPAKWQKVWGLDSGVVGNHRRNWNVSGYQAPDVVKTWPGSYNGLLAANPILASFLDINQNRRYEYALGESPIISGHEQAYMLLNDAVQPHVISGTAPLNAEFYIQVFHYPSEFTGLPVVFIRLRMVNRSNIAYDSLKIGWLASFTIGNSDDDYAGTDSILNMIYAYNSDDNDNGSGGYGAKMPAAALLLLNTPLSNSMILKSDTGSTRPPANVLEYANFLSSRWSDGKPLQKQGEGYLGDNLDTRYLFSGDLCNPSGWNEPGELNQPGPRNILAVADYGNWLNGEVKVADLAFLASSIDDNNQFKSVCNIKTLAGQVQQFYRGNVSSTNTAIKGSVKVFPNPVKCGEEITISMIAGHCARLRLFNAFGSVVAQNSGDCKLEIPRNLPSGLYTLLANDINDRTFQAKVLLVD